MKTVYKAQEIKILTIRETIEVYADKPQNVIDFWNTEIVKSPWYDTEKEALVVFSLNAKLRVKNFNLVTLGLVNQTLTHAREVFRAAIVSSAVHIILVHNHPSGNPMPSSDDIKVFRILKEVGTLLGIEVLDSLIIGQKTETEKGYASLKEMGV